MLAAGSVSVVCIVALMHLVAFAAPPQGKSIVGEWRGSWFERDREATLSGKTLTFVTPASEAAFTIEGTWMHGTVRSRASGIVEEEIVRSRQ